MGAIVRAPRRPGVVLDTGMCGRSLLGNRETPRLTTGHLPDWSAAEPAEPRAEAKGNAGQQSTRRAQNRVSVSQALERIRQTARQRKKEKFTALFHHVSIDHLEEAFFELKENAAPGVDGLTCRDYEQHLERNLEDLHARVHRGAYRALPWRPVYIPKPDARQRPIAVAALEDKIVQRVTAAVLSAPELLYAGAMFHDMGLTHQHSGADERFEVDGANVARDFLRSHGIPQQDIDTVWTAIALHTTPGITPHLHPAA